MTTPLALFSRAESALEDALSRVGHAVFKTGQADQAHSRQ